MCQKKPGPRCTTDATKDWLKQKSVNEAAAEAVAEADALAHAEFEKQEGSPAHLAALENLKQKRQVADATQKDFLRRDRELSLATVNGYRTAITALRADEIATGSENNDALQAQAAAEAKRYGPRVTTGQKMVRLVKKPTYDVPSKLAAEPLTAEQRQQHQIIIDRYNQLQNDPEEWEAVRREHYLRTTLVAYQSKGKDAFKNNPRLTKDALTLLSNLPANENGRKLTAAETELLERAASSYSHQDYLPEEKTVQDAEHRAAMIRGDARPVLKGSQPAAKPVQPSWTNRGLRTRG